MKNIAMVVMGLMCGQVLAQEVVQDFTLVNVVDGKNVSLGGFGNSKGIAIIFTSNECPYDQQYRKRISALKNKYQNTIQFLLVNSYTEPRESTIAMARKFPSWGMDIPYLADKDQVAMGIFGADKSPEAFLLKKGTQGYAIVYRGAIDDNPLIGTDVDKAYLDIAIEQMLANKKIEIPDNRAAGCAIRKKLK
ncbi:MAG TPA: redoxin domain-containing protein [Cyclobacteriaceae bacterium]|nr:redoxin domain-containing protein [Cyclobacteriaceae bacterium]MCB9237184.1 redoxin domain-containing protein [Flammeovirgaceae bacterium]MCB0499998.1 redoxin domain-containing protein [Cyclobacteriaceae bacterium]MCO5270893.1 redoxin domain-containing protein [Cyclobacteriaceae bacterium]MCW5901821.1 redoxin domain-containing protein [Cyclobacteriaceae bacterium]